MKKQEKIEPLAWCRKFIIDSKSNNTARQYLYNLDTFEQFLSNKKITLSGLKQVDYNLLIEYEAYLKEKHWGYSLATLINKMATLVTCLKEADKRSLIDARKQKILEYKIPSPSLNDSGKVMLEDDEINTIYGLQLDKELYCKVRDMFVLACLIGQRISDLKGMKCRSNNDFLEIWSKKSKTYTPIPKYDGRILDIFARYNNELPVINTDTFDRVVKALAKDAGLVEEVEVHKEMAWGEVRTEFKPKWTQVSSHTGRRTLASNLMACEGLNVYDIASMTGHKDIQSLARYDRRSKQQRTVKVCNALVERGQPKEKIEHSNESTLDDVMTLIKQSYKVERIPNSAIFHELFSLRSIEELILTGTDTVHMDYKVDEDIRDMWFGELQTMIDSYVQSGYKSKEIQLVFNRAKRLDLIVTREDYTIILKLYNKAKRKYYEALKAEFKKERLRLQEE